MRVLIVSESDADRVAMARHLTERSHTVQTASSARAAEGLVEGGAAEVVVLDWALGEAKICDLIQRLRAEEGTKHIYTIVVMADPSADKVSGAFAAGTDDLLRRPFLGEELVVRVVAIERIKRWAAKILGDVGDVGRSVARLRFGRVGDSAIREDLGALFQRHAEMRATPNFGSRQVVAVEIPVSLVNEKLECRLQIGIDADALREAAELLLGDSEPAAEHLADLLREVANVAGGAFVGAAEADGYTVTLGLPRDLATDFVWGDATGTAQELTLTLADTAVAFSLRVLVESRELTSLAAGELRPGMVLARDVRDRQGGVILPASTRLTESAVLRLAEEVDPGSSVVVLAT